MSTKDFPFFWDYEQTKQALQELVENRKLFVVGFAPHNGICSNVLSHVPTSLREAIEELMEKWPEFSGDSSYPVPCPHGGDPGLIYEGYMDEMQNMYDHGDKYGQSRQRLVKHLIKALEEL